VVNFERCCPANGTTAVVSFKGSTHPGVEKKFGKKLQQLLLLMLGDGCDSLQLFQHWSVAKLNAVLIERT